MYEDAQAKQHNKKVSYCVLRLRVIYYISEADAEISKSKCNTLIHYFKSVLPSFFEGPI
jgi:hypothetical protein